MIVLIADAAQNGLGKEYESVTEGLAFGHDHRCMGKSYRLADLPVSAFEAFPQGSIDGRIVVKAMRKEMLSMYELASQLRLQQVEHITEIKLAKLEGDGRLSVLKCEAPPRDIREACSE